MQKRNKSKISETKWKTRKILISEKMEKEKNPKFLKKWKKKKIHNF